MGLSFFETMQGHLVDRWGRAHPADFDVKAEATHLRRFVADGTARLTGVVHAPPWVDRAPAEGALRLGPRRIAYDLCFADEQGRALELSGAKTLDLRHLLRSMTTLPVELTRGGDRLARGVLRFDLHEALSFATTWRPGTSMPALDLRGFPEGLPGPHAAPDQRVLVRALCEALIVPGERVPAVDARTVEAVEDLVARLPDEAQVGWRTLLRGLDGLAQLRHGVGLAGLDLARRRRLLGIDRPAGRVRRLVEIAAIPVRIAHFGRPDYLRALGMPDWTQQVREPAPRYMQRVTPAEALPDAVTELEAEVVVVGTGAGGGTLAAGLAERGVAVAVVEAGRYHRRDAFSGSPVDRMTRFARRAGLTFSLGTPPISIPLGRMVGGTTAINSGTCFRTPGPVLAEWREELGFPDEFAPAGMQRWFEEVEQELGVGPNAMRHLGRVAEVVAAGAEEMGLPHAPLPRNAPGCDGRGACCYGCPTDAKRSSNVSWVPRALEAGAALFTGLPVTRILRRGRRVVAVEARGADRHGVARTLRIRAGAVVLACGSLLTPLLLRDNGWTLPWIGRNLSVHPGFGALGMLQEPGEPWNAVPQGYGFHGVDERIRFEGFWLPPHLISGLLPVLGEELTRWMDAQDRTAHFGFMVRDRGVGRVHRGPEAQPVVRYHLSDTSVGLLRRGASVLAEVLLRGGATEVLPGIAGVEAVRTIQQARALADRPLGASDFNLLGAHPLGTCRMGPSPEQAAIDFDHRVFGTDNLYVVDGSAVPTSLGVNPQLTIMALARRAAERLAAR